MTAVISFMERAALLLAAVAALLAPVPGHSGDAAGPLKPVTLQLNWKHQFQFAGYYAAIEKGYFREEGLEVRLQEVEHGQGPVDAVLAGRAKFGIGASELALRRARGDPLVVLAVVLQHSPLVLIARGEGIQSLHELAGKRLMLMPHETELYAYLRREGVPAGRFVEVPHSFDAADLVSGRVDAVSGYSTDEPFELRRNRIPFSMFSPRAAGIDFYGDSLFTSAQVLREDPRGVAAFRRAALRGWKYALDHPEEVADLILAKYSTRHTREHLLYEAAEVKRLMRPDLVEIGHVNPGRWRHIADVYSELGMLPAEPDLGGFVYDPSRGPDPEWIYRSLAASVLVALLVAFYAWRTGRFNRALHREMDKRLKIEKELRQANERLQGQIAEIRKLQGRLEEQVTRDSLTGLHNRRYFDDMLERELPRAQRHGYPVSVALVDIDNFKRINDTWGHQAGDAFLSEVAQRLADAVRAGDVVCRWGGEEFVLVLPNMSLADAAQRAESWREQIRDTRVRFGEFELNSTVSMGIASYPGNGRSPADLLKAADEALYRAKREGRDRVRKAAEPGGRTAAAARLELVRPADKS